MAAVRHGSLVPAASPSGQNQIHDHSIDFLRNGNVQVIDGEEYHPSPSPSGGGELVLVRDIHLQTRNSELLQRDVLQRLGLPSAGMVEHQAGGPHGTRSSTTNGQHDPVSRYHQQHHPGQHHFHPSESILNNPRLLMLPGPAGSTNQDHYNSGHHQHGSSNHDSHDDINYRYFRGGHPPAHLSASVWQKLKSLLDRDRYRTSFRDGDADQLPPFFGDYFDDLEYFDYTHGSITDSSGTANSILEGEEDLLQQHNAGPQQHKFSSSRAAMRHLYAQRSRLIAEYLQGANYNPFIDQEKLPVQSKIIDKDELERSSRDKKGFRKYVRDSIVDSNFWKAIIAAIVVGMVSSVFVFDMYFGYELRRQVPLIAGAMALRLYLNALERSGMAPWFMMLSVYASILAIILAPQAGVISPFSNYATIGASSAGLLPGAGGSTSLDSTGIINYPTFSALRLFFTAVAFAVPCLYLGLKVPVEDVEKWKEQCEKESARLQRASTASGSSSVVGENGNIIDTSRLTTQDGGNKSTVDGADDNTTAAPGATTTIGENEKTTKFHPGGEKTATNGSPELRTTTIAASTSLSQQLEGNFLLGYQGLRQCQVPPDSQLGLSLNNTLMFRQYEDVTYLGEGGFGVVYKAKNKLDQSYAAFKVKNYRLTSTENIAQIERSFNEVKTFLAMKHKHLVDFHMHWCEESQFLPDKRTVQKGGQEWPLDEDNAGGGLSSDVGGAALGGTNNLENDQPGISNVKMSGSGRMRDLSCAFCMSHDVCDAYPSNTGFLAASRCLFRMTNAFSA